MSCKICLNPTELFCTRCRDESYCGTDCQRQDWAAHKAICKPHVPKPVDANGNYARGGFCGTCEIQLTEVEECSSCRSIQYCSKTCQVSHWSDHKDECKKRGAFLFEKATQKNDYYTLGLFYKYGTGIKANDNLSFLNFMRAANGGDAKAMNNVGMAFLIGDGTEKNSQEASVWFRAAGYAGDVTGFHNLGLAYKTIAEDIIQDSLSREDCTENLDAVHTNIRLSFESFKRAAEMGFHTSFQPLADRYRVGMGCEKNEERALFWESKI